MSRGCPNTTFVPMTAAQVTTAAKAWVDDILERRQGIRASTIRLLTQSWGIWRLTWRPPFLRHLTEIEAAARTDAPYRWDNLDTDWQRYWEGDLERAKQLITSAEVALGGVVYVGLEDAAQLAEYLNPNAV